MKYALIGEHLGHSYSKIIHEALYKKLGIDASYDLIECQPEELEDVLNKLKTGEYQGFNVTIPYKKDVFNLAKILSFEILKIGSTNTVLAKNGELKAYNTDYYGFIDMINHYNIDFKDKNVYILGTGGASLAIKAATIDLGGKYKFVTRKLDLTIAHDDKITYEDLEKIEDIDIIVNTTPVGMYPNVGVSPIKEEIAKRAKVVIDIIFNPRKTKLLQDANSNYDGLYMLVSQAVRSDEIWQNKKFDIDMDEFVREIEEMIFWIHSEDYLE